MTIDVSFLISGYKWSQSELDSLGFNFATSTPTTWFLFNSFFQNNYNQSHGGSEYSKNNNPAIWDQQDIVRYFLLPPSNLSNFSGDQAINTTLVNSADYRVSFSDVIDATFLEEASGEVQLVNHLGISSSTESVATRPHEAMAYNAGDVVMNKLQTGINDLQPGEAGFWLHIHELGHAVGGLTDVYTTTQAGTYLDNQKYTMMSYNVYGELVGVGNVTSGSGVYASGLMLLDIAALQDTYDTTNTSTRSDDTIYSLGNGLGFEGASANDAFLYTIWDGGDDDDLLSGGRANH